MQGLLVDVINYLFNFQFVGFGVLLGSSNGVFYCSGDGGGSWMVVILLQGNMYFYSVIFFVLIDQWLIVFLNGVFWFSCDGGQIWMMMVQLVIQDGYFNYSNLISV